MSEKEKTLLKQLTETAKQLSPHARDVLTAYAQDMAADKLSVYDRSGTEVPGRNAPAFSFPLLCSTGKPQKEIPLNPYDSRGIIVYAWQDSNL